MPVAWQAHGYYGDSHVLPVNDERFHTFPMCWCNPSTRQTHRREELGTDTGGIVYTHRALDPRI